MVLGRGGRVPSVDSSTPHGRQPDAREAVLADTEQLIADIMAAQQRLQRLFAYDRSDPLFTSHLTLTQIKILMLLSRHGTVSGGELAGMLGVGAAALSGMIDRLVVQDLVTRTEDLQDRRVRRIGLTKAGGELIGGIITAGAEKHRRLLSRLTADELAVVAEAMHLMVRAASDEAAAEDGPAC
jgi:DNA-binding MarR family transcriptional regulator